MGIGSSTRNEESLLKSPGVVIQKKPDAEKKHAESANETSAANVLGVVILLRQNCPTSLSRKLDVDNMQCSIIHCNVQVMRATAHSSRVQIENVLIVVKPEVVARVRRSRRASGLVNKSTHMRVMEVDTSVSSASVN